MTDPTAITDSSYTEELLAQEWAIVDFWAPWCQTCLQFAPIFSEVGRDFESRVRFLSANVDEAPGLSTNLSIAQLPTVILFQNGQEVFRGGPVGKEKLEALLAGFVPAPFADPPEESQFGY